MNQKHAKVETKIQSLQFFLIRRFLIAVLVIYVCEQLIYVIYEKAFQPLLLNVLQIGDLGYDWETIGSLLILLVRSIWKLAVSVTNSSFWLTHWLNGLMNHIFTAKMEAPDFITTYGSGMERIYYIALIVYIILFLMLSISPYFFVGWWYVHGISKLMQRIRLEERRRQKQEEKQRNLLFSDIVHDVKTPITTIVGYSQALTDGIVESPDKQAEYLNAIHAKSMRISELITVLFEFIKLDSAGFELHQENMDLAELLRETVITLYTDFEDKGIELDFDIVEDPCPAYLDRIQMSRVITNLLTNAIRYSKSGDKALVSMQVIDDDNPHYLISVADTGLPITREFAEHIFEPFSRSDEARQTTSGGSGLGLSIAHKVAAMHGGELLLNLDYGNGYEKAFQIIVPVSCASENDD